MSGQAKILDRYDVPTAKRHTGIGREGMPKGIKGFQKGHIPWCKGTIGIIKHTEESKQKLRQFALAEAEVRRARITGDKNPMKKQETQEKVRQTLAGRLLSTTHRENLKQVRIKLWQEGKYVQTIMRSRHLKPNQPEQALIKLFADYNLPFRYVGDGDFILGGKCPDFLNTDGKKQLIELFSDYWHPLFDIAKRTEHFRQYGFQVLILWEDELDNPARVIRKVKKFVKL